MEKLIALQDINDTIKAGDRFDAPDRIFVALGLAALDVSDPLPEPPAVSPPTRRRRGSSRS